MYGRVKYWFQKLSTTGKSMVVYNAFVKAVRLKRLCQCSYFIRILENMYTCLDIYVHKNISIDEI